MPVLETRIHTEGEAFQAQRRAMLQLVGRLRELEARAAAASAKAKPLFDKRHQLRPRERLARLLDPGSPGLERSSMAGWLVDQPDPEKCVPGGGVISGIGTISGTRCVITVNDAGIDAGAIQRLGGDKLLRAQDIAMQNKLPFVQLIESAGANLLMYRVEGFVNGGKLFYNLARLSAAGIPVVGVVHGSSTAGGAYMPGLSDHVIMVRGRAKAFLAGPPLLKAATGEIATDEELGGAVMHTGVSGLGEYLAEDDADALRIARELFLRLQWGPSGPPSRIDNDPSLEPRYPTDQLAGAMPLDIRTPIDMREIIARIVDGSELDESGAEYGPATAVGHAALYGQAIGIITNNGPIDPSGATKATHFIQSCCQAGIPLLYLQNTTGYIVGKASEQAGMIKHGSKMIQAVSNATVPSITLMCGASFGAGNYGMCGRAYGPRFVFSWPNTRTAVMGGEPALTMRLVTEATAQRRGEPVDAAKLDALERRIVENFERQAGALHTSARLLDDGIVDPRDTRKLLGFVLDTCAEAARREVRPLTFGVARPLSARTAPTRAGAPDDLHRTAHPVAGLAAAVSRRGGQSASTSGSRRPFGAGCSARWDAWASSGDQAGRYGGAGLDYSYSIAIAEALGHARCGGVPMAIGVQTDMATPALARFGSDEVKREFLAPSIAGDMVACLGVSEVGAGSDVASIRTTARKDGGDYVIRGGKMWTTNGTQADWMCLLANTSEGAPHRNKTLICLPMDTPGIEIARKLTKAGMRASDTAQIFFDDVRVPQRYRIGEEGMGSPTR